MVTSRTYQLNHKESNVNALNSLKRVAAKRPSAQPQIVLRRSRLIAKIWEHIELFKARGVAPCAEELNWLHVYAALAPDTRCPRCSWRLR